MTGKSLAERPSGILTGEAIEQVLIHGDLGKLSAEQRTTYMLRVCESLGLNPLTQPFAYIPLGGKLVLYAKKDATDQLRKLHGVAIPDLTSAHVGDVFVVTAKAIDRDGRVDASTGAVATGTLKGDALANALMKAETKAKRRVTLSICGLGILDETELETIPTPVVVESTKPIALEPGAFQILKVNTERWGATIDLVNHAGEYLTYKTSDPQCARVCEYLAQQSVPVTLELEEITRGKNKGRMKLAAVHRWLPPSAEERPLHGDIDIPESQDDIAF